MPYYVPPGFGHFTKKISSFGATRPAAVPGTSITTGTGVYGTYVQLFSGATVTSDVWGIWICINGTALSTVSRVCNVKIGVDPAGGTSYTDVIVDLIAWSVAAVNACGGTYYYFPLRIKAGSSIAASALGIGANTVAVAAVLYCNPKDPSKCWAGSKVDTFGPLMAITSGTTSDGAYAAVGSAVTHDYGYLESGLGVDDATATNAAVYSLDVAVGDASNKRLVVSDQLFRYVSAAEQFGGSPVPSFARYRSIPSGSIVYARVQCSTTPDSNITCYCYGVRI